MGTLKSFLLKKESTDYFWELRNKALHAKNKFARLFYTYRYHGLMNKFGCSIPLGTVMEGKPVLPHGLTGIFISKYAVIGKGAILYQQVTIGSNTLEDSKGAGAPVIGDNVLIGVGAKVIGKVTVGNNSRIGANAVVVKDVPASTTVVLPEPRMIYHDEAYSNDISIGNIVV